MEFIPTKTEIITAINNLDSWMKPEYVKKDLANMINSIYIEQEPFGVVCVFSAWNYPLTILIQPLAAAIAAGVCVCVCLFVCVCLCVLCVCACVRVCVCMCVCVLSSSVISIAFAPGEDMFICVCTYMCMCVYCNVL